MKNYKELLHVIDVLKDNETFVVKSFLEKCNGYAIFAEYIDDEKRSISNLAGELFGEIVNKVYGAPQIDHLILEKLINFISFRKFKFYEIERLKSALFDSIHDSLYVNKVASKVVEEELRELFFEFYEEVAEYASEKNIDFKTDCDEDAQKNFRLLNEYKKAVDESNIVSKTDLRGVITYVNKQFCIISGYREEELLGKPHNIVRHPDMPKSAFKDMWETIKAKKTWKGVVKNLKKDGDTYIVNTTIVPIIDVDGEIIEFMGIRHDVTELERTKEQLRILNFAMKRKVDELYGMTQDLEQQATIDALTGVYNRYKFNELFDMEIKKARANKTPLSLIMFDIDRFKEINDIYGHQVGDKALVEIAQLALSNKSSNSIFARWGGEEFVILEPSCNLDMAAKNAEALRAAIEGSRFESVRRITVSFGVAEFEALDERSELLQKADEALYLAKRNGRNRVEIFKS